MLSNGGGYVQFWIRMMDKMEPPQWSHTVHGAMVNVIKEIQDEEHEEILDPWAGWIRQQVNQTPVMTFDPACDCNQNKGQDELKGQRGTDEQGV